MADRYRILEHVGAGGMGDVYRAEHTTIGKVVAIKTLSRDFSHKATLVDRFLQEARAASLIRHPNIVDITDFGHATDGTPFFAMEFLEGEDLKATLTREGPMGWERARRVMRQILLALQAAHDKGVIHRDMKPDNCFRIRRDDDPDFIKVVDFGIAKVSSPDGEEAQQLTQTGAVIGTAAYMSPEQAKSLPLDARTDVYSAGVILYQLLTGTVPFESSGFMGVLYKHIAEPPEPLRKRAPDAGITAAMEGVVLKAMAKDPTDRYGSAAEFAAALSGVDASTPAPRASGSLGLAFGIAGVVVALGLGGAYAAGLFGGNTEAANENAAREPAEATGEQAPADPETAPPEAEAEAEAEAEPEPEPEPGAGSDDAGADAPEAGETEPPPTDAAVDPGAKAAAVVAGKTAIRTKTKSKSSKKKKPDPLEDAPSGTPVKLDAAAIRKGLAGTKQAALDCGTKHGGLPGAKVKVDINVAPSGKVTDATAKKPFAASALGSCVAKAAAKATFATAEQPTKFTYSFTVAK